MGRRGQRRSGGTRTAQRTRRVRDLDNEGIIPVLARAVREVENGVARGDVRRSLRTKFQVVALLAREERTRVRADDESSEAYKAEQLKRLDGIGTILAKTAARDPSLLSLLAEDADVSDAAKDLKREMLVAAGSTVVEEVPEPLDETVPAPTKRVVPQSVIQRRLANPFLVPDFTAAENRNAEPRRLATWELIGPLLNSFERASSGAVSCMSLPEAGSLKTPGELELMPHQAQVVASTAAGHRTFLLADEPGLGKTAQALLAAEAAKAFPLLVVVPNVVKANWAREAGLWTPHRPVTVVHGDGQEIDAFADVIVVNYEILDRHVGWLGDLGLRGIVVDEAHFIKNKASQRSQNVLALSERIRARMARPLLIAMTGTPLINDIEDFRAIWQFLGWIDEQAGRSATSCRRSRTAASPRRSRRSTAPARQAVIEMGIVRRRKIDVAKDIPARRVADMPVELDDVAGRSIRAGRARAGPAARVAATPRRSRPAPPDRRSPAGTASTTTWSAGWRRGSATTPRRRSPRTTSSR